MARNRVVSDEAAQALVPVVGYTFTFHVPLANGTCKVLFVLFLPH